MMENEATQQHCCDIIIFIMQKKARLFRGGSVT